MPVSLVAWLSPGDDYDKEFSEKIDSGDVIVSIDLGKGY